MSKTPHTCPNCAGIQPESCIYNPDRSSVGDPESTTNPESLDTATVDAETIKESRRICATATSGPWELWTSCSWRRFGSVTTGDTVIEPTVDPRDGQPDLFFRNGGSQGPDATFILHARIWFPRFVEKVSSLLTQIQNQRTEIEQLRRERDDWQREAERKQTRKTLDSQQASEIATYRKVLAWIRDHPNDGHDVHEAACEAINRYPES